MSTLIASIRAASLDARRAGSPLAGFYSAEAGTYPVALIRMSDVTVVNAGLNWAVNETVTASLRVENLLDKEYQTVDGYGQPGRQIFIGLKTRF